MAKAPNSGCGGSCPTAFRCSIFAALRILPGRRLPNLSFLLVGSAGRRCRGRIHQRRRLTVGAVAHAPRPSLAAVHAAQAARRSRNAPWKARPAGKWCTTSTRPHSIRRSSMQFGPICELATAPRKTSEMLDILKHMGVTAYGPRQRGNLQNPLPLPLTFSAEEKWWTKYASSEAPASDKPWEAVRREPGDSIIEQVPQAFRRCFRQLVDGLSLNNLLLKPHSMKRGDATSPFRATNSLDGVVLKGRWANQRTAQSRTLQPTASFRKQKAK